MSQENTQEANELSVLDVLNKLLQILGNVDLETAKTWAEVKENARQLRAEGHEDELQNEFNR